MTAIDPTTLDPGELGEMLAAWADGDYATEAAVGLLTHAAGGLWLRRNDFRAACIEAVDDGWSRHGTVPMAVIDWDDVRTFLGAGVPASSGEASVLRTAASLAGMDAGPLREVTASLDVGNLGQVLDALAHRAGWHEHHITRTVTGLQTATGVIGRPRALPTFEEIRARVHGVLGDAQDWLRSDWRPGTGPTPAAAAALRRAQASIATAKAALDDAARQQRSAR